MNATIHTPTTTNDDMASAIRWVIDNRRPDVSLDKAIRTLRIVMSGNTDALRIIDELANQ